MAIKLYNTLSRQKEEFVPRTPGEVSMYACGPTTYNFFHLGNARMLVVFDMIRRYFQYRGFQVTYVQNFTDIDDKIIARATKENKSPGALAEFYIDGYFQDAQALNIIPASIHPKATEHIGDMIDMIRVLESKGLAYDVDGDVYFAVSRYGAYGKLSRRSLEDMRSGARIEIDQRKENPMDFALWKKAAPGEPSWESPWGPGRPGWHIECSAMSYKYLGPFFDIHGGGGDLVFPHHENEMAQSEAYMDDGQGCARYWMHNAFITIKTNENKEEKMSKSSGNFFLVRDVRQHFSGEVIRFYLLSTHYRSPAVFDQEKLEMAAKGLDRLKTSVRLADEYTAGTQKEGTQKESLQNNKWDVCLRARKEFEEAMDDDFNSAQALAVLFDLARDLNTGISQNNPLLEAAAMRETIIELAAVLGFDVATKETDSVNVDGITDIIFALHRQALEAKDQAAADFIHTRCHAAGIDMGTGPNNTADLSDIMDILLTLRARAREAKDWSSADMIRDCCKENGIVIEDTREGVRWYVQDIGEA